MIKMKVKTKITVTPAYKRLMQNVKQMQGAKIEIGFFEDAIYSISDVSPDTGAAHSAAIAGYPVAQVAYDNNFGYVYSGKMIRRPFFDMAVTRFKQKRGRLLIQAKIREIFAGKQQVVPAFREIGSYMQELIQYYIAEYPGGRVSEFTAMEKGHDNPLVWSGKMHDSVTYEISLASGRSALNLG